MRNVTMIQILFILLCLLGYHVVTGQSDYVVTAKGDTIPGKVKYLNFELGKKVQVTNDEKKKSTFNLLEVKAFKLENELYHNIRTNQGYTIMKINKSGYLSLYTFQLPNQMTWNGSYLYKADGTGFEVPSFNFKKVMIRFLSDCPEVSKQIEEGKLTKSKLNEIIDRYNECIQANTVQRINKPESPQPHSSNTWTVLEKEVRDLSDFSDKGNALEMINEIKTKLEKGEKIPNFLIEGIKSSLKDQTSVQQTLAKALEELK